MFTRLFIENQAKANPLERSMTKLITIPRMELTSFNLVPLWAFFNSLLATLLFPFQPLPLIQDVLLIKKDSPTSLQKTHELAIFLRPYSCASRPSDRFARINLFCVYSISANSLIN